MKTVEELLEKINNSIEDGFYKNSEQHLEETYILFPLKIKTIGRTEEIVKIIQPSISEIEMFLSVCENAKFYNNHLEAFEDLKKLK